MGIIRHMPRLHNRARAVSDKHSDFPYTVLSPTQLAIDTALHRDAMVVIQDM